MLQAARPSSLQSYTPIEGEGVVVDEQHVPQSVRSAQRRAATALVAAVLAFVATVAVASATYAAASTVSVRAPAPTATQGTALYQTPLSPDAAEPATPVLQDPRASLALMADSLSGLDFEDVMMPQRCTLVAPVVLRQSLGLSAPEVQQLPAGTKVFPLRHRLGWVQVLVANPGPQDRAGALAGFGWLPMQQDGADLLQKDALPPPPVWTGAPVTPEALKEKWSSVREENNKLKASLATLQSSMRSHLADHLRSQLPQVAPPTSAAPPQVAAAAPTVAAPMPSTTAEAPMDIEAVAEAAKDAVNVQELKKDASVLEKDVQEELKGKQLLQDLGSLFR